MQYQKTSIESAAAAAVSHSAMDRRRHDRYDLEAAARFSWRDDGGVRWRCRGLTRDISETGIFVVAGDTPPSGARVRLEVHAWSPAGSGLLMQTTGKVVRVEASARPAGTAGFAIVTSSLVLRNCRPGSVEPRQGPGTSSGMASKAMPSYTRKPN